MNPIKAFFSGPFNGSQLIILRIGSEASPSISPKYASSQSLYKLRTNPHLLKEIIFEVISVGFMMFLRIFPAFAQYFCMKDFGMK